MSDSFPHGAASDLFGPLGAVPAADVITPWDDDFDGWPEDRPHVVLPPAILRPYQEDAVTAVFREFGNVKSTMIVKATGTGKTVVLAEVIRRWHDFRPGHVLFVAHREELIVDGAAAIRRQCPHLSVGIEKSHRRAYTRSGDKPPDVVVAGVQSISKPSRLCRFPSDKFTLLIVDECFPSGTMIGDKRIEDISVGDVVDSFNHEKGVMEQKKVARTFRSKPQSLVTLHLSCGKKLTCTGNHPVFSVDRGCYVPAISLQCNDMVQLANRMGDFHAKKGMEKEAAGDKKLPLVSERDCGRWLEDLSGERLLHASVRKDVQAILFEPNNVEDEQEAYFGADEEEEPNAQGGSSQESKRHDEENGSLPEDTRRQRKGAYRTGENHRESDWAGDRADLCHRDEEGQWLPVSLQDRRRRREHETCPGDRRQQSHAEVQESAGRQEAGIVGGSRVDRVEVHQRTGDGTFGGLCADGHVYNFEVEDNHNYYAEGVLVHNCHHLIKNNKTYWSLVEHFKDAYRLGATATADRGDGVRLSDSFASVAFNYGIVEAIADGYLVPIAQKYVRLTDLDLAGLKRSRGDLSGRDLDEIMSREKVAQQLTSAVWAWANFGGQRRQTMLFTAGVRQARICAEILNRRQAGCAVSLDGTIDHDERSRFIQGFKDNAFQFLCSSDLLIEGVNLVNVRVVAVGRPTTCRSLYAQIVGRGLRTLPGVIDGIDDAQARKAAIRSSAKPSCLVLDFVGNSRKHKLVSSVDLLAGDAPDDVLARVKEQALLKGPTDAQKMAQEAFKLAAEEEDRKRAERRSTVVLETGFDACDVDPFDVGAPILASRPLHRPAEAPSDKMLSLLHKHGVPTTGISRGQAGRLVKEVLNRHKLGLATYKQISLLKQYGCHKPYAVSREQATRYIDAIRDNNWQAPAGLWQNQIGSPPRDE
jgi:superfamily II DNA or RNA helicase